MSSGLVRGAHCLLVDTDHFFNTDDDGDCFSCLDLNACSGSKGYYDDDDDDCYSQT